MTVAQARAHGILGIVSKAELLGRVVREARHSNRQPVDALVAAVGGVRLFSGKITDVYRYFGGGFARGDVAMEGLDECRGHTLSLSFQNEHLVATLDGTVIASVPDLIAVLDAETGLPVTTEGLRYGLRVAIVGFPCAEQWRTPAGLACVGPGYFGYDVDYRPIETIDLPWSANGAVARGGSSG
jgi:DUF917 family protein